MGILDTLWLLLPDSAMPVVLLGTACLVLLGIVRPLGAAAIALVILAAPLLEIGLAELVERLPWWVVLLVMTALICSVLRGVFALFLGREGASHLMALLALAGFRAVRHAVINLARGVRWLIATGMRMLAPRAVGANAAAGRRALLIACLLVPTIASAQTGRGLARGVAKGMLRSGEKRMTALLARDARRDAVTAIRRLRSPRSVFRYVVPDAARKEARRGLAAGTHFTTRALPGRPMSGIRAWGKYGLPRIPRLREHVTLPKGTPVRFNRALGGGRGVGEIGIAKRLPMTAINRTVRLPR